MDVLGQNYTLQGLVRCGSLTVAIKADTQWVSQLLQEPLCAVRYIVCAP